MVLSRVKLPHGESCTDIFFGRTMGAGGTMRPKYENVMRDRVLCVGSCCCFFWYG